MKFDRLAQEIFDDILSQGGKVYIVGGYVRDEVMHIPHGHDIDVEVYRMTFEKLYQLLCHYGEVNTFGASFAIMQLKNLPHYDFALPRRENKTGTKHRDFQIKIDPDLPLKDAILRRDLTMNALLYDYQYKQIIDLCHGMNDIQQRKIRCVNSQTFSEDPLRVLRIARFLARFDMTVEEKTKQLCCEMVQQGMLEHLSLERIYQEYCHILMSSQPSRGLMFLKDIHALPPYLQVLASTHQRLDFHPEDDVLTHTLLVLDVAALVKDKTDHPLWFMWACLFHDIGKPLVTTPDGHAPHHNEAGVEVFQNINLIRCRKQRQYISTMIMYHMHLMNMSRHQARDLSYLRLLKKIDGKVSMNDLIYISCCDKLGRGKVAQEQYDAFWLFIQDKRKRLGDKAPLPLVDGRDLIEYRFQSPKHFGKLLEEAYDLQLQGYDKEKILRSLRKYEQG